LELHHVPIYEYQCQACKHKFEKLQKVSDKPLSICPQCQKPELKKMVSAAAFRLSGGGWYETDFKTGNKKNLSSAAGADDGGSTAKPAADSSPSKKDMSKAVAAKDS
jgi:putative FmdB family regulatory protein